MPEPQPGARPADGSTPGAEPERDPAVADEPASPPVPSDQPAPSAQPETPDQPAPSARPEPRRGPNPDQPAPSEQPEAATAEAPAPRWSGSAPVPPPAATPTRVGRVGRADPAPAGLGRAAGAPDAVDPWAGVDTGGWDLPSAELPPLPPTMPYPTPPATRQWSGPPAAARSGRTRCRARRHRRLPRGAPRAVGPMDPGPTDVATRAAAGGAEAAPGPRGPPRPGGAPAGLAGPQGVRAGAGPPTRRWPWLLLLTLACCCGCPAYYGFPISAQYPVARRTARAGGRPEPAPGQRQHGDRPDSWRARYARSTGWPRTRSPASTPPTNGKQVTVFGGTGFRLNPESDAEAEISRLTERYALDAPESVDTGVRGRHERCAVGRSDGQRRGGLHLGRPRQHRHRGVHPALRRRQRRPAGHPARPDRPARGLSTGVSASRSGPGGARGGA